MGLAFFSLLPWYLKNKLGYSSPGIGIILASLLVFVWGIIDDFKELSVAEKFLAQFLSSSILVLWGVRTFIVGLGDAVNMVLTFFWLLAITNAFNHLDILDGLAGSVAFFISASFSLISIMSGQVLPAIFSVLIFGVVSGFLIFNLPPARVYMGNAGSHFLGFLLGSVALLISYAPLERRFALLSPIFILGFPILDTTFLICMRLKKRISPFQKSNDHIALRLISRGFSPGKTLVVTGVWSFFFSLGGIVISQSSNILGLFVAVALIFFSTIVLIGLVKIRTHA